MGPAPRPSDPPNPLTPPFLLDVLFFPFGYHITKSLNDIKDLLVF